MPTLFLIFTLFAHTVDEGLKKKGALLLLVRKARNSERRIENILTGSFATPSCTQLSRGQASTHTPTAEHSHDSGHQQESG